MINFDLITGIQADELNDRDTEDQSRYSNRDYYEKVYHDEISKSIFSLLVDSEISITLTYAEDLRLELSEDLGFERIPSEVLIEFLVRYPDLRDVLTNNSRWFSQQFWRILRDLSYSNFQRKGKRTSIIQYPKKSPSVELVDLNEVTSTEISEEETDILIKLMEHYTDFFELYKTICRQNIILAKKLLNCFSKNIIPSILISEPVCYVYRPNNSSMISYFKFVNGERRVVTQQRRDFLIRMRQNLIADEA